MKKIILPLLGVVGIAVVFLLPSLTQNDNLSEFSNNQKTQSKLSDEHEEGKEPYPHDHWYQQRSYPDGFDRELFIEKMGLVREDALLTRDQRDAELGNPWTQEGPGNIGGRFNCLEQDPVDPDIIYAGAANGGIFKTTDGGTTWTPVFDEHAYLAIGEIKVDPTDPDKIWVGTGDRNFGGGSHIGNGLYLSTDAGDTWTQIALEETGIITEIHIDPTDPDRIFVGTLGNPYEKTTDRGVYRTTDGGMTWNNVLFVSDSSGVCDMIMDPTNSDILYASFFNRINQPFNPKVSGPDSRIYKSTDGGDTWNQLTGGLPTAEHSRIGMAIAPSTPNTLYALYVDGSTLNPVDLYKTIDGGANWSAMDVFGGGVPMDPNVMGGFGWYFGQVHVNPYDEDQITVQGVDQWFSVDGGTDWYQNVPDWWTYEVHADKHDILYLSSNEFIIATDGGLYRTTSMGSAWTDIENIPVTQFYHIDADPLNPGIYGGGAQDNGTMQGNAASFNSWSKMLGGDGFRLTWLELAPGEAYCEVQNGGLYYYDGFSTTSIAPTVWDPDRVNWDMPYVINESTANLFVGTSKVKIMEGAPWGTYVDISTDLTKVAEGDYVGSASRHTISEIEQDKINDEVLYAGTTDGKVWRGNGSGTSWSWTDITGSLPDRYCTGLRASPDNEGTIYAMFSGYTINDTESYLYVSTDYGDTWTDIGGDLPSIPVNDLLSVPGYEDEYLFVALDGGVYFSQDAGTTWDYVGIDMPQLTISELDYDPDNEKLIAGTYSRSMWSYDVNWLSTIEPPDNTGVEETDKNSLALYPNPVNDLLYIKGTDASRVSIYTTSGKYVGTKKLVDFDSYRQANLGSFPSGTYLIRFGDQEKKIIKR